MKTNAGMMKQISKTEENNGQMMKYARFWAAAENPW